MSVGPVFLHVLWPTIFGHSTDKRSAANIVGTALYEEHKFALHFAGFVLSHHALRSPGYHP